MEKPRLAAAEAAEFGEPLDASTTLLLANYFSQTDGTPGPGIPIAFSELPNATLYAQAFQSYTGAKLGSTITQRLIAAHHDPTTHPFPV